MHTTSARDPASRQDLSGHVALVTGANHGIGAATAMALADRGAAVLVSYLRISDPEDFPEPYRSNRAKDADDVLAAIDEAGGRAVALEADLRDTEAPARLFNHAETELGPVDILVNNATGWTSDTFAAPRRHDAGVEYVHPDKPRELWVNEVGVAPTHRGRGVGKDLLRALLERGRERGCDQAWVITDPANRPATSLYESVGGVAEPGEAVIYSFDLDRGDS